MPSEICARCRGCSASHLPTFILIAATYGFLSFFNTTSHLSHLMVPSSCDKELVTKAQRIGNAIALFVSTTLGLLFALYCAYLMDLYNRHRLALLLATGLYCVMQISVFAVDVAILGGDLDSYLNFTRKEKVCEIYSNKFKYILPFAFFANIVIYISIMSIYSTSHSYFHYSLANKRTIIYISVLAGYLMLYLSQMSFHAAASKNASQNFSYDRMASIFKLLTPSVGCLAMLCVIPFMSVIKIDRGKPKMLRRYKRSLFVHDTFKLIITALCMLLLALDYCRLSKEQPSEKSFLSRSTGGFIGNLIYLTLLLISTRFFIARKVIDILVIIVAMLSYALSVASYHYFDPASTPERHKFAIILMKDFFKRLIAMHGLLLTLNVFISEQIPNDVINFAIALISILILLPLSLLQSVENEIFYIVSRGICLIIIVAVAIRKHCDCCTQ